MTTDQRIHLMTLFGHACEVQGWKKSDKAKRYAIYNRVLGHKRRHAATIAAGRDIRFENFDDEDFTEVKKEMLHLADKIPAPQPANKKRQLLWVIRNRIMPCIALYRPAEAYVKTILIQRVKKVPGVATMDDLANDATPVTYSQLQQFLFTLARALDRLRADAGHTGHQMHQLAGLHCKPGCKECLSASSPFPGGESTASGASLNSSDRRGEDEQSTNSIPDPEYYEPVDQPF